VTEYLEGSTEHVRGLVAESERQLAVELREPIVVYGREKVLDFTYIDDCVSHLLGFEDKCPRETSREVATTNLGGKLVLHGPRRPDGNLDLL